MIKKWFRIFELINGVPTLVENDKYNWFESEELAQVSMEFYLHNKINKPDAILLLPVYERAE